MRERLVRFFVGQAGKVAALEGRELARIDTAVAVGVGDREERLGQRADGRRRCGRIRGQGPGGGDELFPGDRGAAIGNVWQVQIPPDRQVRIDDALLRSGIRRITQRRCHPLSAEHMVVLGQPAVAVHVEMIETVTDLGGQ
nr:hypothetical protein [Nocardia brasiliensis]